ncbi:asparagine synthase [Candidatus Woesearchaeota archaeon]|nr:asparagine synthase [Candidatus Woesearchaeota archaeon]
MEIYLKNNNLVEKESWEKLISSMESPFDSLETNKERAKRKLREAIEKAIIKRTQNIGHFGILFSGGVDSTLLALICKNYNLNFTCYSIGIENSQDLDFAQQIAKKHSLNLKFKLMNLEEMENSIKETLKILKSDDIVWASVGSVVYAVLRLALQNNEKILFSGLGTEEIFAGYQRHEEAFQNDNFEALHKECWSGLKNMWQRDLLRDFKIASNLGVEVRTPYMDESVIKAAMSVHPMYKLDKEQKKIILREIAADYGLETEFAWRKKKAAQYGSNFVKGMDKLAKKAGFSTKKEYLQHILNQVVK